MSFWEKPKLNSEPQISKIPVVKENERMICTGKINKVVTAGPCHSHLNFKKT